jgi:hypothetical protein
MVYQYAYHSVPIPGSTVGGIIIFQSLIYAFAKGMTCIQMHHCLFCFPLVMISDAIMLANITIQFNWQGSLVNCCQK